MDVAKLHRRGMHEVQCRRTQTQHSCSAVCNVTTMSTESTVIKRLYGQGSIPRWGQGVLPRHHSQTDCGSAQSSVQLITGASFSGDTEAGA
jgi:hypothetical protein